MDYKGDIHTNGTPKCGQDNLLKKDNMATAEARSFDIKVGDPMDKTDGKKEGMEWSHFFINIPTKSENFIKTNCMLLFFPLIWTC